MKFFLTLVSLALILVAAVVVYGVSAYRNGNDGTNLIPEKTIVVDIPRGTGLIAVADMLVQNAVIPNNNKYVFIVAAKIKSGLPIQAGEYEFAVHQSVESALRKLQKGDVVRRQFTIPEGRTSYEIANILRGVEGLAGDIAEIPAEGKLLPETYQYHRGDDRMKKISEMQSAMDKVLQAAWNNRAADIPLKTPDEVLVLASIVEKETGKADERKRIAGVFINRLKIGMPLQSDPTVIYGITLGRPQSDGQGPIGRRLLSKDLETPSAYNTYLNVGLPPTPIANPGKDAIEAVVQPEQHNYLFFVADGTGGHVFASSLAEHNRNVAEWRKIRRAAQ